MNWELLFASEMADRVAATLLHSLWQAALLAMAAAIVCWWGRRLSVATHYLVYVAALAGCAAALPLTYYWLDSQELPVAAIATQATPVASLPAVVETAPTAVAAEVETSAPEWQPPLPLGGAAAPAALAREPSLAIAWRRAIPWLLVCYAVGVVGMLGRLAIGVIGAERLRRAALPISDGPVARALAAARRRWPLRGLPAVARSERVVVPALVGLLKPTILLPISAAAGLTPQELELVLAHELAHVVRRDLWVTLFQRVVEAILFFNPAMWYLSRRVSTLREFCCDEAACLEASPQAAALRVDYASALLRMAELARPALCGQPELLALAAAGRSPSEFRRRIARLLGEPVREPLRASRGGLAATALATLVLAVGVVWAEPSEQPADDVEVTLQDLKELEATEADEDPAKLVERLQKLLPPLTDADRAVAEARARTFGLGGVDHISMRTRSWSGEIAESFQPHDGSLASLWAARGKSVDEKMRRNTDSTMTVAWSGPQLLIQSDHSWNVDAATPPGLYTQARYWDGTEGWWSEIRPGARNIYQYAALDKLTEHLHPAEFPFWEGAGGRLPWNQGAVVLEEYNVTPELTRYQHEGTETIDGVECDVYAGPERSERLWIEKASGLLKATSRNYWGEELPNYYTETVKEAAGRSFSDSREYSEWLKRQPAEARELLNALSCAAHWPLTKPGNMTVYRDYRELQPGVEFPMRAERLVVHPNHPGGGFKYYRSETEATDVTEKFDIRKLAVQALPRVGDAMTDRRTEPPVDYLWSGDEAKMQTTITEMRDSKIAATKYKEEQDRLINETPINSVADAINVLTEGPRLEPTKVWARAIKYLADHREEALPAVVAALDAEERDHPISKLAFALRAMGDPRAVPALIRALPKTLLPSRSDYGLLLDGQGSDHDELLRFMMKSDIQPGNGGETFGYGRAFREVAIALQRLTAQDLGEMELNWVHQSESPAKLALQREQFHRVAARWAEWWEANWRTKTDDEAYSSVKLPPLAKAALPRTGAHRLPLGPNVRLEEVSSGWIVQSAHESRKRCFVDLDTMREGSWPDSLPPIEEIGVDSPELFLWARREGFDLMGFTITPPDKTEPPLYCLKPLGMDVWKITPRELRELKNGTAGKQVDYDFAVDVMIPRRVIEPPFDHDVDGDSFLYITREGTAGVVRMTAQVPKKDAAVGSSYDRDDLFMPSGFYPGAKVVFAELKQAGEAAAPKDQEAPAQAPAPKSTKLFPKPEEVEAPARGEATLRAMVKSAEGKPLANVYLTLWRDPRAGGGHPEYVEEAPSEAENNFHFYRNVTWLDGTSHVAWQRSRSAHPNDGHHSRGATEFEFSELPAGRYRITAMSYDADATTPDPTPYAVSDVITLNGNAEESVELTPLAGDGQLRLRVVDSETQQPIPGMALRLRDANEMPIVHGHGSGNFFEWTDDDGAVRFGALPAGDYSVEVMGKHASVNDFVEFLALKTRVAVTVAPGEQTIEIDVPPRRLDEAEIERRYPFSTFGVVTDDQDQPLEGVEVSAATGMGTLMGGGSVLTDAEGRYRLYFGAGMLTEISSFAPMGIGVQAAHFFARKEGWAMPEDRKKYNLLMSDRPREELAADRENSIENWGVDDLDSVVYPHQPREVNFQLRKQGPLKEGTASP